MTKSKPKKQVLDWVFRRLFKPCMVLVAILCLFLRYPQISLLVLVLLTVVTFRHLRIPTRRLMIATPFLVAIIVALFSQYVAVLPIKGSSAVPYLILAGLIIGAPLAYKFRVRKIRGVCFGAAIVIGFFLVPYFGFFLGQIQLYAVDAQLPAGYRVIEMRISFDKCTMTRTDGTEVTAWPGRTITLRPGMTRVHMGTLDIPAGTYTVRKFYMGRVDVDVEAGISTDPETGQPIPPENYQTAYDNFKVSFREHLKTYVSEQCDASNWSGLVGSKFTFTITTIYPERIETIDPPMNWIGFGGPDITLDLTLTEKGEVTMTPILDLPPGFPSPV